MAASVLGYTSPDNFASSADFNFTPTKSPVDKQRSSYDAYNTDFTKFLGSQDTVPQLQQKYNNMYNIPYLQDTANKQNRDLSYVGNQLATLPDSVNSSTSNSLLTQGQKDTITNARQAPLARQYNQIATAVGNTNNALGTAQTNQGTMVTAEQAQQMKMVQPWLQKYDANTIMNAAENANWTTSNQMELDRLLANQQAHITLTNAEQQRLADLSKAEAGFENALKTSQISANASVASSQLANQNVVLSPGQTLRNTITGTSYTPYGKVNR